MADLSGERFLQVRFGGSGGQGVILMGVILALAGTLDRRYVVQTQSYGPEARGGYTRSDVILSSDPVDYPQLLAADLLVCLSDEAAHAYSASLRQGGVFIFDQDEVPDPPPHDGETFAVPFTRMAKEATGRAQTANVLTLGAVVALTAVVTPDSLEQAVLRAVPPTTEEVNLQALRRGLAVRPEESASC